MFLYTLRKKKLLTYKHLLVFCFSHLAACKADSVSADRQDANPMQWGDATTDSITGEFVGDAEVDPVSLGWMNPRESFRTYIELQPHPDSDRTNVPVIVALKHDGQLIDPDVSVYELVGGEAVSVKSNAWAQPNGRVTEVAFAAMGLTPKEESRRFVVYYHTIETPKTWNWEADSWASIPEETEDAIAISGTYYEIRREISSDSLVSGPQTNSQTYFHQLPMAYDIANGFFTGYQLETSSSVFPATSLESHPVLATLAQGDGDVAAIAATFDISDPVEHRAVLTYRLFREWPLVEVVFSVTSEESNLRFSSDDYNVRRVYLSDDYDRMNTDIRGDETLASIWQRDVNWQIAYNSTTNRGFGWFLLDNGVLRATDTNGTIQAFDSYSYSVNDEGTAFRYLWSAGDKDQLAQLFSAMAPGVKVGPIESFGLNIVHPVPDELFFMEDSLTVDVTTPGSTSAVTAEWILPDNTHLPIIMTPDSQSNNNLWHATTALVLDESHPTGSWTLAVYSGDETRQIAVNVKSLQHPHLFFSGDDVAQLADRRFTTHAAIWSTLLSQANSYGDPIPEPGPEQDIRAYGDRLVTLALIQLLDTTQPYDAKLWKYFFTMLRYPNWQIGATAFKNHDLAVGHFLTALAITYDWHYQRLSPQERAEVRQRLLEITERWLETSYLRYYPNTDWNRLVTLTNNHYWINHEGVAAVSYAFENEFDETKRQTWLERLDQNLSNIVGSLEPDGASCEGMTYGTYGSINLYPWLDMRDHAQKVKTADRTDWFVNSIYYQLYSILPGGTDNYGGVANFGDCFISQSSSPLAIGAWLANKFNNGTAQWIATKLNWINLSPYYYLWYDPSVPVHDPTNLPTWHLFDDKGIFVWRSSWDNDATYFSLKSGSYFGGHEHPDAGQFILNRGGVPYVVDLGYSYLKATDEHNVLLVDGLGQYGDGQQWMSPVDPVHWADIPFVLADERYFDILANPGSMYRSEALQSWQREVVAATPDVFVIRDTVQAATDVEIDWFLHSYRSNPPTAINKAYTYLERRLENPFIAVEANHWRLHPQDNVNDLHLMVMPEGNWENVVEPTFFVPEHKPDLSEFNKEFESYQLGYRLHRRVNESAASAISVLWFGDELTVESRSSGPTEALRVNQADNTELLTVLWPTNGNEADLDGYSVTGNMAGRRYDEPAFWGRDLIYFSYSGHPLLIATTPVSIFSRTEHLSSQENRRFILVETAISTQIELFCPEQISELIIDGISNAYSWNAGMLSFSVEPGMHQVILLD